MMAREPALPVSFALLPPGTIRGRSCGGPPAWAARAYAPVDRTWPRLVLAATKKPLGASPVEAMYKPSDDPDLGWDVLDQGALPDYLEPEIRALLAEAVARLAERKAGRS